MNELYINESMRYYCTLLFRGAGLQSDPDTVQTILEWAEFYWNEDGMKPLRKMTDEQIIEFYYRIMGDPDTVDTPPSEEPKVEPQAKMVVYEVVESDGYHLDRIKVFMNRADAIAFCNSWNEHSWYEARVDELEIF